jgi:hypothetical protein
LVIHYQQFGGACCFLLQDRRVSQAKKGYRYRESGNNIEDLCEPIGIKNSIYSLVKSFSTVD